MHTVRWSSFVMCAAIALLPACGSDSSSSNSDDASSDALTSDIRTAEPTSESASTPGAAAPQGAEEQIASIIEEMQNAINDADSTRYKSYLCPELKQKQAAITDDVYRRQRDQVGTIDMTASKFDLWNDGRTYLVEVTRVFSTAPQQILTTEFAFDDSTGHWLACEVPS